MQAVIPIYPAPEEWYWQTSQGYKIINTFISETVDVFGIGNVAIHASNVNLMHAVKSSGVQVVENKSGDPLSLYDGSDTLCLLDFKSLHAPRFAGRVIEQSDTFKERVSATMKHLEHHPCQVFTLVNMDDIGHVFPLKRSGEYYFIEDYAPDFDAPTAPGFYVNESGKWIPSSPNDFYRRTALKIDFPRKNTFFIHESNLPESEGRILAGISWPWTEQYGSAVWRDGAAFFLDLKRMEAQTQVLVLSSGQEVVLEKQDKEFVLPEDIAGRPFAYSCFSSPNGKTTATVMPVLSRDELWWIDDHLNIISSDDGKLITRRQDHSELFELEGSCLAGPVALLRDIEKVVASGDMAGVVVSYEESRRIDSPMAFFRASGESTDELIKKRLCKSINSDVSIHSQVVADISHINCEDLQTKETKSFRSLVANFRRHAKEGQRQTQSYAEIIQKTAEQAFYQANANGGRLSPRVSQPRRLWEGHFIGPGAMFKDGFACLDNYSGEIGVFGADYSFLRSIDLSADLVCDFDVDEAGHIVYASWPMTVYRGSSFDTPLFGEKFVYSMAGVEGVDHVSRLSVSGNGIALVLRGKQRVVVYSLDKGQSWAILPLKGLGHCCDLDWKGESLYIASYRPSLVCRFDICEGDLVLGGVGPLPNVPGQIEATEDVVYVHSLSCTSLFDGQLRCIGFMDLSSIVKNSKSLVSSFVTPFSKDGRNALYLNSSIDHTVSTVEW